MDIRTLLTRVDVIENNQPSLKKYLSESLYNTPEMQPHWKRIDEGFVRGYEKYLAEVALTPEQIQSIFKQASGGAAAGEAPKEPGKLAALVDKVLPAEQAGALEKTLPEPDAGPVQGFEQKAAAAVQNIQGADQATKQSLMQWIKQGVAKPETQQLILAAVGAGVGSLISKVGPILSMIPGGGPVAAAVTGAVIAGAVSVASAKLQGKDWKSAFKGAIKPALMGGASAVIGNLATTAVSAMTSGGGDSAQPNTSSGEAPTKGASLGVGQELPDGEVISALDSSNPNSGVTITKPDGSTYSVSRDTAQAMSGQQGISPQATGPVSQGASSDPTAGVTDKQPMTLDQVNAAKAALRAGNANDMSGPMDAPAPASDEPSGIQPRGGYGAQEKINAAMQAKVDADYAAQQTGSDAGGITARPTGLQPLYNLDGSERPGAADANAAVSNQGRLKMDQWRQDVDSPNAIGKNFDAGNAPIGANGQPMRAVPMDEPATPQGINRLTGNQLQAAPAWDQMTPDQQAAVTARQQQQAVDAAQGTQNAKDYWANKPAYTRGLKESFAESKYIDKQATLRKWLVQESRGQRVHGLALKPTVKEGIMDSIKGMFGGKKGAEASAAGGVTADALNKAWAAAGSPTDSEEVAKVLQSAGVSAETVTKVFADLKLPAPGSQAPAGEETPKPGEETPKPGETPAPTEPAAAKEPAADTAQGATAGGVNIDDLVARINKLAPADKQKIIAALQG
jgi:hypothetical protein